MPEFSSSPKTLKGRKLNRPQEIERNFGLWASGRNNVGFYVDQMTATWSIDCCATCPGAGIQKGNLVMCT